MKNSSAAQSRADFEEGAGSIYGFKGVDSAQSRSDLGTGDKLRAFEAPSIERMARALSSRQAGRNNAAKVSEQELKALLSERKQLLNKKYAEGLSRLEENRLTYVRWSLDRIEDAQSGHELEALSSIIDHYEVFARDLHQLLDQLNHYGATRR